MDPKSIYKNISKFFDSNVLPNFMNFIRIPNSSPEYDPKWDTNGLLLKASKNIINFAKSLCLKNTEITLLKDEGHTPFILIDTSSKVNETKTILFYGHFDKQLDSPGWDSGKSATNPIIENGRLYGRGTIDDGYAIFSILTAIKFCQDYNCLNSRIICIFEGSEESSSDDLHYYFNKLMPIFGDNISLFCCVDLTCLDYQKMWVVNCIRGVMDFDVKITTLNQNMDSNYVKGAFPDNFMIFRKLCDLIRNENGEFLLDELILSEDKIPKDRKKELEDAAKNIGKDFIKKIPLYENTKPMEDDIYKLLLNNIWKVSMIIKGIDGIPDKKEEGNIISKNLSARIQMRIPPLLSGEKAFEAIKKKFTENTPFNAKVEVNLLGNVDEGWNDQNLSDRTKKIFNYASNVGFGKDVGFKFDGGSVPFIEYFGRKYPNSEITNLGIRGLECNEHGPNESVDLEACKKFIVSCVVVMSEY